MSSPSNGWLKYLSKPLQLHFKLWINYLTFMTHTHMGECILLLLQFLMIIHAALSLQLPPSFSPSHHHVHSHHSQHEYLTC